MEQEAGRQVEPPGGGRPLAAIDADRRYETKQREFDALRKLLEAKVEAAEPWLTKQQLAEHYACGEDGKGGDARPIETAMTEGMPHAVIFGRVKFRVSETDRWLEEHGRLRRRGDGKVVPIRPESDAIGVSNVQAA